MTRFIYTSLSILLLVIIHSSALGQCPVRIINGKAAPGNWCRPVQKPQVMPMPSANPNAGGWQPSQPSQAPVASYQPYTNSGQGWPTVNQGTAVSNRCYTSLPPYPVAGCYLSVSAPPGLGCGCYDPSGMLYRGVIMY